jgi:uncharacterized protein (DUF2384 family)
MVLDVAPGRLIDQLGQSLGLTDEDLSAALNVSQRTLERWRVGEHYPQREARRRLAALTAVLRHLFDTFQTAEAARGWLSDSNRYLGGLTPREVIRVGRFDRIEAALTALDSGIFI